MFSIEYTRISLCKKNINSLYLAVQNKRRACFNSSIKASGSINGSLKAINDWFCFQTNFFWESPIALLMHHMLEDKRFAKRELGSKSIVLVREFRWVQEALTQTHSLE